MRLEGYIPDLYSLLILENLETAIGLLQLRSIQIIINPTFKNVKITFFRFLPLIITHISRHEEKIITYLCKAYLKMKTAAARNSTCWVKFDQMEEGVRSCSVTAHLFVSSPLWILTSFNSKYCKWLWQLFGQRTSSCAITSGQLIKVTFKKHLHKQQAY